MKAAVIRAPFGLKPTRPPDAVEIASSAAGCAPVRAAPADEWNRAAHANVAAMTFGLSPVSLALAILDWGAHLAVAPGKCFVLATQAWLGAVAPAANGRDGEAGDADTSGLAVHAGYADPRFAAPAWGGWPFRAYRDGFLAIQLGGATRHAACRASNVITRNWSDSSRDSGSTHAPLEISSRPTRSCSTRQCAAVARTSRQAGDTG